MKIGYACICLGEEDVKIRTCTQKYATQAKLLEIINHNLNSLMNILKYNQQHHIQLFRISSDFIPFGSSPINCLNWQEIFQVQLLELGDYIRKHHMRVSMHPGQYTIINSNVEAVVERAFMDLQYHESILSSMGLDATHKLILHVGGVYGDKQSAILRFKQRYQQLSDAIKKRLVIENDDRYYHIEDVLKIAYELHLPVVFDNLHHAIYHPDKILSLSDWMQAVQKTWAKQDGIPKLHYSVQAPLKRLGAHAKSIQSDDFMCFISSLKDMDVDIMLEVKDKNISAIKAIQLINANQNEIDMEWERYRYKVMERSMEAMNGIDKSIHQWNGYLFYQAIEKALLLDPQADLQIQVLTDMFHSISPILNESQRQIGIQNLTRLQNKELSIRRFTLMIYRLGVLYHHPLIHSYFFIDRSFM